MKFTNWTIAAFFNPRWNCTCGGLPKIHYTEDIFKNKAHNDKETVYP